MSFASAQPILRNNNRCRPPRKRGTQYAAAVVVYGKACDYWIPAFAGMTAEFRATAGARALAAVNSRESNKNGF
jgi:hypothetical protein